MSFIKKLFGIVETEAGTLVSTAELQAKNVVRKAQQEASAFYGNQLKTSEEVSSLQAKMLDQYINTPTKNGTFDRSVLTSAPALSGNAISEATATPGSVVNMRKPSRPGDTPARQFVGRTLETLNTTLTSYSTERDLLAKDIAKLADEQAQLDEAIQAIRAAISSLSEHSSVPSVSEHAVGAEAQAALEVAFSSNVRAN